MKRVICDHAGKSVRCADMGGGKPCPHSQKHDMDWCCGLEWCKYVKANAECVEAPDDAS